MLLKYIYIIIKLILNTRLFKTTVSLMNVQQAFIYTNLVFQILTYLLTQHLNSGEKLTSTLSNSIQKIAFRAVLLPEQVKSLPVMSAFFMKKHNFFNHVLVVPLLMAVNIQKAAADGPSHPAVISR